jgi:aminocarboxymuconate-semialdehyde decarboxylase
MPRTCEEWGQEVHVTIDAHAHIIPKDFPFEQGFPRMEVIDRDTARMLVFGATNFRASDVFFDVERRIEAMDAAGVDEEIVSPMPPLLASPATPELGLSIARHVNEVVATYVLEGRGRIHGMGMVPMQSPGLATSELEHVRSLGLGGVEVPSHVGGVPIGDPRFTEFFLEVDRLGLSVFIHALPRMDEVALPTSLRASVGVGIEGARGAASLAFGGIADACSLERVLFSHAAGGLPLMLARADYFWAQQPEGDRPIEAPSSVARRFLYDSMVFDPRGLRFVIDYLGSDRVVLGTDFPAMPRPGRLTDTIYALDLAHEDRDNVAFGNARRFLSLEPAGVDRLS